MEVVRRDRNPELAYVAQESAVSLDVLVAPGKPQLQARLSDLGSAMFAGSSADFETFIVNETEKWSKVIRAANIKPE